MFDNSSTGDDTPEYEVDPQSALKQLVRSAAHSVDCPWALYYQKIDDTLKPHTCFGVFEPGPFKSSHVLWPHMGLASTELLTINDTSVESDLPLPDFGLTREKPIRFLAMVPIIGRDDEVTGALAVADHQPHAGLSAAQIYVLRTHAVQVAFLSDRRYRRQADRPHDPASSERLRLLESVVVHANDAILITEAEPIDLPGPRIMYCNAAFTRTTGYTAAEVLGHTPRILQNEQTNRGSLDRLKTALRKWRPVEVELLNTRKDGSEFWVELSIVPVADERGWFTHWVSVQRDVSERKQAEEIANQARIAEAENLALEAKLEERRRIEKQLTYAAFHDDLTKLHNRAYVMDRLSNVFRRRQAGQSLHAAVLFLDLDRFKLVNDSLGHRAGDLLLMEMARRLERCLRDGDTLARVGGDEFVILVETQQHEQAAVRLAERIINQLETPFRLSAQQMFTSCSIGIVDVSEAYASPEELLRDADAAMYAAKAQGPGNYAVFTGSMRERAVETLALQNDLKRAIAEGGFSLHYQPIYDPVSRKLLGVEALVRWHHPDRGSVPPDIFIPIAEEMGVIRDIGRWVMSQACAQVQAWNRQYPDLKLYLNVNISAPELKHSQFVTELQTVLKITGFDPRRLQIEITESVFLHQPKAVSDVLEAVRKLGVRIALDDFGTGYSALEYIDKYEIDTIKIDRTFIVRMLTHRRTMAIVESMLNLARVLELDIVAEGVETQAQLETLRKMKCPCVQGYLLWRPAPPADITDLLSALNQGPA